MCLWDPAGLHVGIFLGPRSGCPCGTRKNMTVGFRWVPCVAAHLLYGQPMWDPQIYNRGISMGPMCGIPPSIWAAYVGPSYVRIYEIDRTQPASTLTQWFTGLPINNIKALLCISGLHPDTPTHVAQVYAVMSSPEKQSSAHSMSISH